MADNTTPREVTGVAPDRMALLHTLAFAAMRLSAAQFDGFTTRLAQALSTSGQAEDSDESALCRSASEHLNRQRVTFHRLLAESLQESLLQAVQAAGMQGESLLESGAMDLSLVDFAAMERKVLIDNLSQAIDAANAEALAVLGMRIAHWLQSEVVGIRANPFRAEIFLKAAGNAWGKFDLNAASQRIVLREMRPEVFLQLGPILQALNQELAIRQVLPDAEQEYRRKRTTPILSFTPSEQEKLRRWLAPDGILNVIDARAVGLLDKAFDQLRRDEDIPPAVRELIEVLRVPLRKAALADKEFFFRESHPARRLVDAVLTAGLACDPEKGSADPLHERIAQVLDCVDPEGSEASFDRIVAELQSIATEGDDALAGKLNQAIADATTQENIGQAQQLAQEDVIARIETGEVPGFVETFLQHQWSRVLSFAYSTRSTKPEVLTNVLKAMDDLIWSVKPKVGPEERKDLVERLPALLSMLNAWLNVVKWEGAERDAFFSELAERHASALRMPAELTPRHQLELRMNVVQKASEHQLAKRAQQQQEAALADFMRQIDSLAPGSWMEFVRNDGGKVNCRLMWISPGRSRFVFAGRQGQLLFALTNEALAQAMCADRTRIHATSGVIGRALQAALAEIVGS
ncbi:DUF1631 family protein [Herbaspirillum sp. ST 5-3]|uniref:DUF1631 family protein n=1 Tax=Oxalobacteraceae TaxID=75682 RepID=UPI0010A37D4B|nr:DUF1631 family protein [Herbaspirillum sp. ST 5-3]